MASLCDPSQHESESGSAMSATKQTNATWDAAASQAQAGRARSPIASSWMFRAALVLYAIFLLARAWHARHSQAEHLDWAFEGSADFVLWIKDLAWREIAGFVAFLTLGLLAPPAFEEQTVGATRATTWKVRAIWWAGGLLFIAFCIGIAWEQRPHLGGLLLPFIGYLLGLRLSAAWLRGVRPLAVAAAQAAAAAVVLIVAALGCASLALSDAPLDFEPVHMTDADKQQLAQFIRDTRPPEGEARQLQLSETEIDGLLNTALGRGMADRKARVNFTPSRIDAEASLILPRRLAEQKYLNLRLSGVVTVEDGVLDLDFEQLQLGRLSVPRAALWLFSPVVRGLLLDDPQVRRIVGALIAFQPNDGQITAVFQPGALGRQVVPSLAQMLWERPDVARQTEIYIRHLVEAFDAMPAYEDRFGLLMQSAFALAAQRSADHDPVLENRAAIFALAILLGHDELEHFVGELLDPPLRAQAARMVDMVMLRGRTDWPRHFLVSAALALLSNEATSDRIGVLKEQLDAQDGGSGFSFGDLLADRAGTRFGLAATRNEASARAMQARIASGFEVAEFFPPADGLPEDLPDAEFQARFGGVGGRGYQTVVDEIERRLSRLPAM